MAYSREAAFLRDQAGTAILNLMEHYSAFIAGGALTSVFSSAHINDFDVFFPDALSFNNALAATPTDDKTIYSDAAVSVIIGGKRIQLIKAITGDPLTVIKSFDFTVCQAAWSLSSGFVFCTDFFQHLAQRRLVFNISAEYPICSLYRARKFIKRGFHFSGIEAIKIGLTIQNLDLNNYGDLRKQLMGIDTMFLKDLTDSLAGQETKEYNLNEFLSLLDQWIDKLDALTGEE